VHARAGHPHRRWRISNKKAHLDVVRNDINVTPLVDVMLVLLIIFMLMTMLMGRGHEVTLPPAKNFSAEKDKMQPVVSIDKEGNLFIEKNKLGPVLLGPNAPNLSVLKEMQNQVEAAWKAPKNPESVGRIYLKADNEVGYTKVYPVLEYLNRTMAVGSVDLAIAKGDKDK
jgi:biopolymer transport protein ExbD